jgi:hypothetical protein
MTVKGSQHTEALQTRRFYKSCCDLLVSVYNKALMFPFVETQSLPVLQEPAASIDAEVAQADAVVTDVNAIVRITVATAPRRRWRLGLAVVVTCNVQIHIICADTSIQPCHLVIHEYWLCTSGHDTDAKTFVCVAPLCNLSDKSAEASFSTCQCHANARYLMQHAHDRAASLNVYLSTQGWTTYV